jgi:hypothetical protein
MWQPTVEALRWHVMNMEEDLGRFKAQLNITPVTEEEQRAAELGRRETIQRSHQLMRQLEKMRYEHLEKMREEQDDA